MTWDNLVTLKDYLQRKKYRPSLKRITTLRSLVSAGDPLIIHQKAKEYLQDNDAVSAWKILMVNT